MEIITYNCFGIPVLTPHVGTRLKNLAREIEALAPDIVFFQEVFLPCHKQVLAKHLKSFPYHFLPSNGMLGLGGGLACFSKFPLENTRFKKFSANGRWSDHSFADKLAEKGFMSLTVEGRCFYNTHLICNYDSDPSRMGAYYSLQKLQLAELMKSLQDVPLATPTFIVGDLNIPPSAKLFSDFLEKTNSVDLAPSKDPSVVGLSGSIIGKHLRRQKIDYILFRGPHRPKTKWDYVFREPRLSDHLGILMHID